MLAILPRDIPCYSYVGTGYANPHAVTGIGYTGGGTTNYVYDNNGNLTSRSGAGYTWDYRNRLTAAGAAGATTTYAYDHENQRVQKVTSSATTTYVNMFYNIASTSSNATTTKHIFTPGGELLATVVGTSTGTTTYYIHPDHLGGTNIMSDTTGDSAVQVLDYYPYGGHRINTESAAYAESRQFIGERYDPESSLSYLNARYYEASRGQFLSQDPVFLALPSASIDLLQDPQQLNSYSYSRNNPIILKDPTGQLSSSDVAAFIGILSAFTNTSSAKLSALQNALSTKVGDAAEQYAQGSGPGNKAFNQLTKDNTAAKVALGVGVAAGTGAAIISGGAALGITRLGTLGHTCIAFCPTAADLLGRQYGSLGTVVQNIPGAVKTTTDYGAGRLAERGLSLGQANQIASNPVITLSQNGGQRFLYLNQAGGVVVDNSGQLVTGYGSTHFQPHVLQIFRQIGTFIWK